MDIFEYLDIDERVAFPQTDGDNTHPYIEWYNEDKSRYTKAGDTINPKTGRKYVDADDDFLIGDSGGFLMNENFVLVNTQVFKTTGKVFEETGSYLSAKIDSPRYLKWLDDETEKRKYGVTFPCKLLKKDVKAYNASPVEERYKFLHPLHITGEMYNFLNFGLMSRTEEDATANDDAAHKEKKDGLPQFFVSQYWWTKIKEFAMTNGLNLVMGKSRRAGWSYQEAIDSANDANLYPNTTNIFAAYDFKYLTKGRAIARMAFDQLNFYEEFTPFNRCGRKPSGEPVGLYKKSLEDLQVAYRKTDGTPAGYQSKLISVSFANDTDAAIGKDARKIKIEELSNTPNLFEFLNVTEPTTRAGSYKVGMIIGFGTGGSSEGDWVKFKTWFYNPAEYDAMEFENVWDRNARNTTCGYYKMYIQNLEGKTVSGKLGIDMYGNCDYMSSLEISNAERDIEQKVKTPADFIVYKGQYSNSPDESFGVSNDNDFVTPALLDHISRVEHDPDMKFYIDGWITRSARGQAIFETNSDIHQKGRAIHQFVPHRLFRKSDDLHGCVRMFYPPETDDAGNIPNNLYRITYDPVAIDQEKKLIRKDTSLNSFKVRMVKTNMNGTRGDIIVASFAGRPERVEVVHRLLVDTADLYNAKILPETDRGNIVATFRKWKRLDLLIKEPSRIFNKKNVDQKDTVYGMSIGNPGRKADALAYFKDWLYETRGVNGLGEMQYNFHYIFDLPFLEEIRDWNAKDNFDRVSDFLLAMYDNKELELRKTKRDNSNNKNKNSIFAKAWF